MAAPDPAAATPSPDDRPRIEALVAECIEAMERGEPDPAARVCAERPDLLPRVQRRLAQLAARGLIPTTEAAPPASIGPYRIRRELGSGGMGSVFLAEQLEPVRREVALKVVKLGMDTREVQARFEAERQALARMNHPHIAQVFDAGATPEGRPYFVMEYVAGQPLTTFCDQQALGPEARLRLLAVVCRAVQHAHDRGFIHRDLKPSNVLVVVHEGQAVPKVIDFGIAKATAGAEDGPQTRIDQVLGTPEYMSPEQATSGGLDVDVRSDVYSLGAILYELLCGELPFDSVRLRRAGRRELERILQDELPTVPSRRLERLPTERLAQRGGGRGGDRATLQRRVTGELDWITLKALAKQREHRYPSALAFAEDIERWLRHEPVLAAPPGTLYRLRKFARRHRVALGAAVAVLLALIGGLAASLVATGRARDAEHIANAALDDMRAYYGLARDAVGGLVDVADNGLADVPDAEPARRRMLEQAIGYFEALRERQPTDPALRTDLVAAQDRIGVLQRRLGRPDQALTTLQRCAADVRQLQHERGGDRRVQLLAVQVQADLAAALGAQSRSPEARDALRGALADLAAVRALADGPDLDSVEARLRTNLALEDDGDPAATANAFAAALAVHERTVAAAPGSIERQRELLRCQALFAQALTRQNRLDEAAEQLAAAVARLQTLPPATSAKLRETEAGVQEQFAEVQRRLGRFDDAAAALQIAIDRYDRLAAEHPDVVSHADRAAGCWHTFAQLAEDQARLPEALERIGKAVAARERLVARFPADAHLALRCVRSLETEADFRITAWQQHRGELAPARAVLDRAIALVGALHDAHPDDPDITSTFAGVHTVAAALHDANGEPGEALQEHTTVRKVLEEQLRGAPDSVELHHLLAVELNNLVYCHYRTKSWPEALEAGGAAREHLLRGLQLDARHRGLLDVAAQLLVRYAAAQFGSGDAEAGLATLRETIERTEFDAATHEVGAITFAQQITETDGEPADPTLLAEAEGHLRAALRARGPLAAVQQRSREQSDVGHHASRQRDIDLRLALADVLGHRGDLPGQAAVLDEGLQIAADFPELAAERWRDLCGTSAQNLLRSGDRAAAFARAELLLGRGAPDARACYLGASIAAACTGAVPPGAAGEAERERYAAWAVAALQRGRGIGMTKRALEDDGLRALRGRADFEALRK